ncbi:MAG TPA: hypothetical protein VN132_10785 [Bdellovibrio sp.]|nr:hypothetical protein [Bdellovibrio sp.]
MKKILIFQGLITILGAILLTVYTASPQAKSFLVGSGLIWFSFLLLGTGWGLIFQKKLIALAVAIIVFKYAILGIIIFTIVKLPWFDPLWFAIGIASFVVSAGYFAITEFKKEEFKEGNRDVI